MELKFDNTINYSVVFGIALLIVTLVGVYWRTRELIFKLHNENKTDVKEVKATIDGINIKMGVIWLWWLKRQERRLEGKGDL